MHAPTVQYLGMVKRILRYLKGTTGRGIVMTRNGHTNIMGYADSDWAENSLDRRSTIGCGIVMTRKEDTARCSSC